MKQKDIFLDGEGDAWLGRNREKLGKRDPVDTAIAELRLRPERVLEIGCSNGWRLANLRAKYGCEVMGVEPSRKACMEAAMQRVAAVQSTASCPALSGPYDLLIYGFCLYLTDPSDWLTIAAEGDRLLEPGGHLIIHDFDRGSEPYAQRYDHREGVLAYHFDFRRLWLSHPAYEVALGTRSRVQDEDVTVLRKRKNTSAIPVRS